MSIFTRYCTIFFIVVLFFMGLASTKAQQIPERLHAKAASNASKKAFLTAQELKINSRLREAVLEHDVQAQKYRAVGTSTLPTDFLGRIHVEIRVTNITVSLLAQLQSLDFEVSASTEYLDISANQQAVTGWTLPDRLHSLAQLPEAILIRPVVGPEGNVGSVTSEGDAIHGTVLTRSFGGIDGTGQTIGVISTGVDHLLDAQLSGDLPGSVIVLNNRFGCIGSGTDCNCPDGAPDCDVLDEGTAMLEIVHDLAPGAGLIFSDWSDSRIDFAQSIRALADLGSTVIVDDIGWISSPVYEDGIIAQTVDSVVANRDVVYVSAAGNLGHSNHEADFADADGDGWHEFDIIAGDEAMGLELRAEKRLTVCLHWNNQYGKASDDYDLYLYNETLDAVLEQSEDPQTGTQDPLECLRYENPFDESVTLNIAVKKFSGSNRTITVLFSSAARGLEYVSPGGSVKGHHAARQALAVGAIHADDPRHDDIADFSSHGPSRIFNYDVNGSPTSFIDRNKPELTAVDQVRITGAGQFGFQNPEGSGRWFFSGTSASAPHVAAVAALIRTADPSLTAAEIGLLLKDGAVDLGAPGFDFVFGYGRVDAFASVRMACPACFFTSETGGFINLSTNTIVPPEGISAGFIVTGSTPRQFVIAGENISGMDPFLILEDAFGNVLETNDDWLLHPTGSQIEPILRRDLASPKDAGFVVTLSPGNAYIAKLVDARARTNVRGIVAINDAEGFLTGSASGDLINISTNAGIPSDGMTAGFIVRGTAPKRYVIAGENISGMDPVLTLEDTAGNVLAVNDDWRFHPTSGLLEAILGRPLNHHQDAGFVVTLTPGTAYIARLSDSLSRANVTGIIAINDAEGFLSLR